MIASQSKEKHTRHVPTTENYPLIGYKIFQFTDEQHGIWVGFEFQDLGVVFNSIANHPAKPRTTCNQQSEHMQTNEIKVRPVF